YFLWNYMNFLDIPLPIMNQWRAFHLARGRQLLDSYQYNQWDPRVTHLGMAEDSFPVPFATVQDGPLSETDSLKADADLGGGKKVNYIQWLRQASINDIQAENYPGPKPMSLFYKILRQSLILEYASLAAMAEIKAGRLLLSQVQENEIIGFQTQIKPQQAPVSVWEILARPALPNPKLSWADYLIHLDPPPESPFARLNELRSSLACLATQPTAELDRLFTETLDACSHRLDVWATTIANAILNRTRKNKIIGIHLGSFGWVEEVRPAVKRPAIQGADLEQVRLLDERRARTLKIPTALPPPLEPLADNGGFISAPPLPQASGPAVLWDGDITHKGTHHRGLASVGLSSRRTREATLPLDGGSDAK